MKMKRSLLTAAAIVLMATPLFTGSAHAEKKMMMPIYFVGEWCSTPNLPKDDPTTNYQLPSWALADGGKCNGIFSVTPWSFDSDQSDGGCMPVAIRLSQDTAPSGTGYSATITASCLQGGAARLLTFKFKRYKGNLYVTGPIKR
jgi:hypothetical protein